ncbi:MAG: ferritin-like domain-containing protein [Candidatus Velthaea sp.]
MTKITRSNLLGAGSAIALVGLPLMTRFVEAAQSADKNDIASLNAAIELERAGIKAYVDAAGTGLISPGVLKIAQGFIADHTAHRDALIAAVVAGGGTPSTNTVKLAYPPLKSEADILRFALVVEEKAASTYLSVIPDLRDRALAGVAASILGVETTHVAMISSALGEHAYKSGFVA